MSMNAIVLQLEWLLEKKIASAGKNVKKTEFLLSVLLKKKKLALPDSTTFNCQ